MNTAAALPHSDEAERATVAGILLDNRKFHPVSSIISARDFYGTRPRLVFQAEAYLIENGVVADSVTLRDRLESLGKLAAAGGLPYIASLTDGTARSVNVEYYARIVRRKSAERRILIDFEHVSKALMNGHSPEDRLVAMGDFRELLETNIAIIGGTDAKDVMFELASEVLGREITKTPPIIGGFLWPGDIGLCSGAGGVGKTWLLQDLSIALASGRDAFGHLKVSAPVRVAFLDLV